MVVFNNFKNDSRVLKEALSLQSKGFCVTVVALHDNLLAERESFNEILIHRIKLSTKNLSKNKIVQLIKYVEFVIRFFKEYKKYKIIHCHDLITLPVGVFAKWFFNKNVKIVYDSHEYAINDLPNQSFLSIKLKFYIEKYFIKYADKVITVSESIANEYKKLYNIPKPSIILNCAPYVNITKQDLFRKEFGIRKDQTIFLYQGALINGRGIKIILEAFSKKNDQNVVVFMGYGPLELEIKKQAATYNNIFFKDAVAPAILLNYTSSADYGISFIEDLSLSYRYCLPNKMFEYLMANVPILVSNLCEMRQFVLQHKIGFITEQNNVNGFLDGIKKIKKIDYNLLSNNIEKTKKMFTWESQEQILLDIYCNL